MVQREAQQDERCTVFDILHAKGQNERLSDQPAAGSRLSSRDVFFFSPLEQKQEIQSEL